MNSEAAPVLQSEKNESEEEAFALKEDGDRLQKNGKYNEALSAYGEALSFKPDYIEAHFVAIQMLRADSSLAMSPQDFNNSHLTMALLTAYSQCIQDLQSKREFDKALELCEVLCFLAPENSECQMMMAILYLSANKQREAIKYFLAGLALDSSNSGYRSYFLNSLLTVGIKTFDEEIKKWITLFLDEISTVDSMVLSRVWLMSLEKDPEYKELMKASKFRTYEEFKDWIEGLDDDVLLKFTTPYFLEGIRNLIIVDIDLERLITNMRRWIFECSVQKELETDTLAWKEYFVLALSELCFMNEYVYYETVEEKTRIEGLIESIGAKKDLSVFNIVILSCYRPLYKLPSVIKAIKSFKFRFMSGRDKLSTIIVRQVKEPAIELRFKKRLKPIGAIQDKTSLDVQQQYEENPYPRWNSVGYIETVQNKKTSVLHLHSPKMILIAGCGTGRHALGISFRYKNALVTGVDLSLSSLAYCRRKAAEALRFNLNLLHGDILDLKKLDKEFDYIESVGVLHHMKEPYKGWAVLVDILKPEGFMMIGLYSDIARRHVVECQNYIKNKKIPATLEGIHEFRKTICELPEDDKLRNITRFEDFYSSSMVRDMVFHVQEHRYTIPQIKEELLSLNLEFKGFCALPSSVKASYISMFPDDKEMLDLDNWHKFEQKNKDCFIAMYQFLCKKNA